MNSTPKSKKQRLDDQAETEKTKIVNLRFWCPNCNRMVDVVDIVEVKQGSADFAPDDTAHAEAVKPTDGSKPDGADGGQSHSIVGSSPCPVSSGPSHPSPATIRHMWRNDDRCPEYDWPGSTQSQP